MEAATRLRRHLATNRQLDGAERVLYYIAAMETSTCVGTRSPLASWRCPSDVRVMNISNNRNHVSLNFTPVGDVVGCGYIHPTTYIFTKNGELVGK